MAWRIDGSAGGAAPGRGRRRAPTPMDRAGAEHECVVAGPRRSGEVEREVEVASGSKAGAVGRDDQEARAAVFERRIRPVGPRTAAEVRVPLVAE